MQTDELMPEDLPQEAAGTMTYFRIFAAATDMNGQMVYKDQTSENGPFADEFTVLSAQSYIAGTLRAGITMDGYVAILAEDAASNHLTYIREEPSGKDRFDSPLDLGLPSAGPCLSTAMIRGCDGMINVFAICADQTIWWKYENSYVIREETVTTVPPGTDTPVEVTVPVRVPPAQPWSDWQQLPGALKTLSAFHNADGRICLVGLNAGQVPYLNMQTSGRPQLPEHWSGWQDISGGLSGFTQVSAAISGTCLIHIFATIGSKIYQSVQTSVGGPDFSGWALCAAFDEPVSFFTLGTSRNGGLYLVAQIGTGPESPLYGTGETMDANGSWTVPTIIGHVDGSSKLVLQPNADLQLNLFALTAQSNSLSYLTQLVSDRWSASWTPLGSSLSGFAVTNDITPNPS